jgi:anaerobic magnesium-protoporphyrin IX monomethyl ester cyclase
MTETPSDKFRVMIVYPNLPLMLVPSIAIGLFTAKFKAQGYDVELFETTHYLSDEVSSSEKRVELLNVRDFDIAEDLNIQVREDMYGDFRRRVEEFEPHLMVYSVVEDVFLQTLNLMRRIEDLKVSHLVGGVFPTYAPEKCITQPEINLVGHGEGENTVVRVAEAVRTGDRLDNIPGTWYEDPDGVVHMNAKDPLVDMNATRPDFSLFDESRFMRPMGGRVFKMIPVETYRGCPFACTYCNSPAQREYSKVEGLGNFLRRKSMDVLRAELSHYMETYSPTFFYFIDDSFLARPKQEIFDFCDMYEEFGLPFWFNTRSESCEPDIMARLKEVGCYRISFGIEAGNEEFRQRVLRRKISNEELIAKFTDIIAPSGIAFSLNVIIGMPGETRELVMDTIELIRSIPGYDALTVSIFTPYHGTVLRDVAVKNKWLDPAHITRHTTSASILTMEPPYLSSEEIDELTAVFPLYAYFPKSEWDRLRRAEQSDAEGMKIREEYQKLYRRDFLGETQDSRKVMLGGSGCRTNEKDSFRISPSRLTPGEIDRLVINAAT